MDRIHEMIMCLNQILKLRYYLANHLAKATELVPLLYEHYTYYFQLNKMRPKMKKVNCLLCKYSEKRGETWICNYKKCNMGSKPYYINELIDQYSYGIKGCDFQEKPNTLDKFV